MAVRVRIASIENQEPPPCLRACPRAPTWLPVHRALRERRALRLASHRAVARRWGMGPSSCPASSITSPVVAEPQRSSLAHRRAVVSAAAKLCAKHKEQEQERRQQQQQLEQQKREWPALSLLATVVIATPPPPTAATAAAATSRSPSAATGLSPAAAATVRQDSKVNPEMHFLSLLEKHGRAVTNKVSSQEAGYVKKPTAKQVLDYQSQPFLSDLVRKGDVDGLRKAVKAGRGMDASNKFGESLVHVACRRGNIDVLRFLLENGGSLTCCDDLGRFPLHEVCWAARPRFDIIRLFLDGNGRPTTTTSTATPNDSDNNDNKNEEVLNLLLVTDKRGCTPLRYVKEESWPLWRQFLDEVVDEYWPSLV